MSLKLIYVVDRLNFFNAPTCFFYCAFNSSNLAEHAEAHLMSGKAQHNQSRLALSIHGFTSVTVLSFNETFSSPFSRFRSFASHL